MTTPAQRNEIVRRQSRAVFSEIAEAAFSLKNLTALLVGNGGVTETDEKIGGSQRQLPVSPQRGLNHRGQTCKNAAHH